jgi:metalloprotease
VIRLLPLLLPLLAALAYAWMLRRQTAADLDQRSAELIDPGLRPILARLAEAIGIERIRVHLYDVPMVNGLASADGRIFITRGFYDRYRAGEVSADEMGSVVAHELGHVALGHAKRRLIDFTGQRAVAMGLGLVLGRFLPGVGQWLAHALMNLVATGLSRRDEYEADAYATALLIKSGIGPAPQVALLRKLAALTGRNGAEPPAWLLTHPKVEARVAAIEANAARWVTPGPGAPGGGSRPPLPPPST